MTTRAAAIIAMRVAGYHNDQRARVRLFTENRITRQTADDAWAQGANQREQGMKCACPACKGTERAINATTKATS